MKATWSLKYILVRRLLNLLAKYMSLFRLCPLAHFKTAQTVKRNVELA